MNHTDRQIILALASGLSAAVAIRTYLRVHAEERQKRAEIEAEKLRQLAAINEAAGMIKERVRHGHYDGPDCAERVLTDLRFETIALRYDK